MWRRVEGITTDSNGALYLSGDVEAGRAIWGFGPDFVTPRWTIEPPLHSPMLAFSPAGEVLIWNSSRNQAFRAACADGRILGAPLGSEGGALDFRRVDGVCFNPQNNVVTLSDKRLRRFTLDGAEVAAWPEPQSPQDTQKYFWEIGDKPQRFKTDHSFASTGWDGQFYLAGSDGLTCSVARYDASGKRTARATNRVSAVLFARRRVGGSAGPRLSLVDVGVVTRDHDHAHLAVLRLSSDFKTVERLVEASGRRAELNDNLAVAPDGTMFIAGSHGSLYVFRPDGALLFTTKASEPPAFATGATAGRGESLSALARRKHRADRDEDNEPNLTELLLFVGSFFILPFAIYYLGVALGGPRDRAPILGFVGGFFCGATLSGWVGLKRVGWFRVPMAGRWLCGVLGLLLTVSGVMVGAGFDPLGLGYGDSGSSNSGGPTAPTVHGPATAPPKGPAPKPGKK